jgi:uncharacterized protein (TIGR02271 family)
VISTKDIDTITAGHVLDSDGDTVGKVGQVYLDNHSGEPEWVTVHTGMFGTKHSFVPLSKATVAGEDVRVPFDKAKIKDAPRVEADAELSPAQEDELYAYYGMTHQGTSQAPVGSPNAGREDLTGKPGVVGRDTSGPTTDKAMTRSEEQVNVGTEKVASGTAKLRKYIVTENQTHTVGVSHQEATVTREPITDANRGEALAGGDLTEEEHEVTLHAEKAVVETEVVPVERITLDTETVRHEETVNAEVRKEQVELHDDTTDHRDNQR